MAFIYVITNDVNGKQYVGQTVRTIEYRFKKHLKASQTLDYPLYKAMNKYGIEHFSVRQLEECSVEELDDREIFWIKELDTYYNGYNATLGGLGNRTRADEYFDISETYKRTQSLNKTAKKHNCSINAVYAACQEYNVQTHSITKGKPVVGFDKNTLKIIGVFPSIYQAAKHISKSENTNRIEGMRQNIVRSCIQDMISAYGIIWRFKVDLPKDFKNKNPKDYLNIRNEKDKAQVVMFDIKSQTFKKFNSMIEAALYLKSTNLAKGKIRTIQNRIGECCRGNVQTSYGYIWKYQKLLPINFENKDFKEYLDISNKDKIRSIKMFNTSNSLLKTFNSCSEAAIWLKDNSDSKATNRSIAISIRRCLRKERKTAYGYKWEWADEYED